MRQRKIPLHRRLLVRLLTASALIAMCAVAATAWIAATTTTQSLRNEQGRSFSDDNRIYDALVGYAAAHRDWEGVQRLVADLANRTGHAITLTTPSRTPLASFPATKRPLPEHPAAVVDPLNLDAALAHRGSGPIDPRAVGPYRLTAKERGRVRSEMSKAAACLRGQGMEPEVVELPSGQLQFQFPDPFLQFKLASVCDLWTYQKPSPARQTALGKLRTRTAACLKMKPAAVEVTEDFTVRPKAPGQKTFTDTTAQKCLDDARRQQLRPYVAPSALLFVDTSGQASEPAELELSADGTTRIVLAAALVLAVTVGVTVIVGLRLIRPLRSLIAAAQQPAEQTPRIPVRADDEIGRLTAAFNDLAERRERLEVQRTTMVNDVAHELRSPLTNIRSWLEAAQDGITPTDRQLLDLLHDEAVLLQHVIDDLRDLAAADAGNLALHREMVRIPDVLDRVASAHHGTAEQAGVDLSTHLDGDQHEIFADPLRLRQIIGNLVGNAIRHTPNGGHVTLTSRQAENTLIVEVADTGSGITPEDLTHVFDRFWRADKSRNRHTGGSGLGLSIARKLTEAHGGSITVHSALGEGTTFTVLLPR